MNTQSKKILAIAAVVALHAGAITLMLAQHGCKSAAQKSTAPAASTPAPAPAPAPAVTADTGFYAPTPPPEIVPAPVPTPVAQFNEPLGTVPATPMPAAAPTPAPTNTTWKVTRGETLSSIAKKYGVTVAALVAANAPKVTTTSALSIGQVLSVPTHAEAPMAAKDADAPTYKVATGDTLSKIASRNGTTVKALKELNSLTSDNIREGQMLKLPASSGAAPASVGAATPAAAADTSGPTYQVKSGDTLGKIAAKVGVKTAELMSINGFTDSSAKNLKPGQMLKLPANAHAPDESVSTPSSVTPVNITPLNLGSPAVTPVTVMAVPAPASGSGSAPPVTPVSP